MNVRESGSNSFIKNLKMKDLPIPSLFLAFLTVLFLVIRNVYYFRVWKYHDNLKGDNQYKTIFPKGSNNKLLNPIKLSGEITNEEIKESIKKVNLYSYLAMITLYLSIFAFILQKILS